MPRVLVIEDEVKLLRALERGLRTEGYEVATAADGDAGSRLALAESFDCIVLDRMLPRRDGLQVLADLRQAGRGIPVLLLTARDAVEDRVAGLDAGADDYLVKPFAFAELLARLRVLLRGRAERVTMLHIADLQLDLLERRASRGEVELPLSRREFEVLAFLLRHRGHAVTREMLVREVWREPGPALTNVIDVTINTLRRKLERAGLPALIQTLRGVGYLLRDVPCE
jgi:DNA-binding response OmpR family regulator